MASGDDPKQSDKISESIFVNQPADEKKINNGRSKIGLIVGSVFGVAGFALVALSVPFVLPAIRKHCLPYVPATDDQLSNLSKLFRKHSSKGGNFLDIGSGDGRICRLAAKQNLFTQVHGVELNYMLVLFSRFLAIKSGHFKYVKYFHKDLWKFPTGEYDAICIFGVESMMMPLEKYLLNSSAKSQTIYACRFPFSSNITQVDEIGKGVDTVWVYRINEGSK